MDRRATSPISLISKMSRMMSHKIVINNPHLVAHQEMETGTVMVDLDQTRRSRQIAKASKRIQPRDTRPSDQLMMTRVTREPRKGLSLKSLRRSARGESFITESLSPTIRLTKLSCKDGHLKTQLPR